MAKELIAVTDYEVEIQPKGANAPAKFEDYTKLLEDFSLILTNNLPTLHKILAWLATGCTLAGHTFIAGGNAVKGTALTEMEGTPCFKENEPYKCNGLFILNTPPNTVVPCFCDLKISKANQDKVTSE